MSSIFKSNYTRKLKSEELTGAKIEVPQEDYTCQGKYDIVKRQTYFSAFQILLGIALSVCGYILNQQFPFFGNQSIFILGLGITLFGLLALIWCIKDVDKIKEKLNIEYWYNTQDHTISKLLFIASIIKAVFLITTVITLFIYKSTANNYFQAATQSEDASQLSSSINQYNLFFQITIAISFAGIIILVCTTYSAYAFSNTATSFRISLYAFTLLNMAFCGGMIYATLSTQKIESIHSLQGIADFWSIRVIFYITVVYLSTLIAILITNFTKSMNYYMSMGTLLLLICVVFVSFNGKIYRNAREVSNFAQTNCQNEMQMIHQDFLVKSGCPNKYIFKQKDQVYPDCEMDQQTVFWENDLDKENQDKLNQIQCLNKKCCGITGKMYADWFYVIATLGQLISQQSFVIIGICYYLSTRYSGSSSYYKKLECLFLVLGLLVLSGWVFLVVYYQYQPITQKPGLQSQLQVPDPTADTYKLYQYADVTNRVECEKSFSQYFSIYYQTQFSKNEIFECVDDCQTAIIRVSVTATYYKIILSQSFNDPHIKIFDSRFQSVFNVGDIQPNTDFVAAEGTISTVKNFFMQNVCLYSYEPQANHNLIVRVSKINPTTGGILKKIDFKPSKAVLKQINKKSNKQDVSYSQTFDDKNEQQINKNISFQSVLITVKDAQTNQNIQNKLINLQVYFHHQECIEQNNTPSVDLSGVQSQFLVKNLYTNTYTIFVKVDGYNYSCKRISLTEHYQTTEQIVYLNKNLQNKEMRAVLEWNKNNFAQLDLLVTLSTDKSTDCIAGYFNENCQKIYYERKSQHPYYQSIKIDQLGANDYLFYIKHNLSQKSYNDLVASGKKNINQILAESGAHFSIYVAGLEYPVYESGIAYFDNNISTDENLIWLVSCMNGSYGNQVYSLNQYWTTKSTNEFIIKSNGQELPSSGICSKYLKSLFN
ncbi:hypothetical protein ABPG74_000558 [Tetrahymena malaccensis]